MGHFRSHFSKKKKNSAKFPITFDLLKLTFFILWVGQAEIRIIVDIRPQVIRISFSHCY